MRNDPTDPSEGALAVLDRIDDAPFHHVQIRASKTPYLSRVQIDGEEVKGVVGVAVYLGIDKPNLVVLQFHAEVDVEGTAAVLQLRDIEPEPPKEAA